MTRSLADLVCRSVDEAENYAFCLAQLPKYPPVYPWGLGGSVPQRGQ